MKSVGFTGTKRGMSLFQKITLTDLLTKLQTHGYTTFHHGDCVGADAEAHKIAVDLGYSIVIHPPTDNKLRAYKDGKIMPQAPYLIRNRHIVQASSIVIAAPKSQYAEIRSGTWATIRYAKSIGKQLVMLER